MKAKQTYIAFLRGINVGGHHKVPMADLKEALRKKGFTSLTTLLNSGNVIFDAPGAVSGQELAAALEDTFGFPIPVLLRKKEDILHLHQTRPFEGIEVTKDIRLYVSFLKEPPKAPLSLPWTSEDGSYRIIHIEGRTICSILDLSLANTPQAMDNLERMFGRDITTRNWNTIERIAAKL